VARQFIYHMAGLNKAYGAKKVLENIHLSFYPDAKIGILGPNGAGKSTVLRIMAGLDSEFTGEAWLAEGATLRLPAAGAAARREPERARQRDGGRRRKEGDPRPLQRTDDELFRRDRRRGREAPGHHRRRTSGISTARSRWRWKRCAARPAKPRSTALSGGEKRRVALCQLLLRQPDLICCSTSRPTTLTPKASPGSKSTCANIPAP
jgi:ATPase subunit of ABC transporter with duplicated ATPase domains